MEFKNKKIKKKIKLGFITQCCLEMTNGLICIGTTKESIHFFDQTNWNLLFTLENEDNIFGHILCLIEISNEIIASSQRSGKIIL